MVDDNKQTVKLVAVTEDKPRQPGRFEGKVSCTPDAFDPLTDEEMKEHRFGVMRSCSAANRQPI